MKKTLLAIFLVTAVLSLSGCRNAQKKGETNLVEPPKEEIKVETKVVEEVKIVEEVIPKKNEIVYVVETPKITELDSDGDGIPDRLDAEPKRPLRETLKAKGIQELIILDNIKFDSDKLSDSMLKTLDIIAQVLQSDRNIKIKIVGHTCDLGTDNYNFKLSEKRALTAQTYLLSRNAEKNQMTAQWKGEKEPMFANINEKNRSKNRRVQIIFYEDSNKVK